MCNCGAATFQIPVPVFKLRLESWEFICSRKLTPRSTLFYNPRDVFSKIGLSRGRNLTITNGHITSAHVLVHAASIKELSLQSKMLFYGTLLGGDDMVLNASAPPIRFFGRDRVRVGTVGLPMRFATTISTSPRYC